MTDQYQKIDEDILGLTGTEEWKTLILLLEAEAAATIQNQLEADDWATSQRLRGYVEGLRFVAGIRETTKVMIEQAQDASV